jgi:hypothetical protein
VTLTLTIPSEIFTGWPTYLAILAVCTGVAYFAARVMAERHLQNWKKSPDQLALQQINSPWWAAGPAEKVQHVDPDIALLKSHRLVDRKMWPVH